ncbi:hypothetical protein PSEEN2541 [Pseudomonas entomophila L48]|uniref:Uncharacterized protein n=1 Tax=Pseudomonas entomophila (strain L48) TaxID=384676 RepID=Q1IAH6_PSEE4|nr:hypothetical protein PSEEN2541 [Pseudomonas entomophila L48]
MIHNLIAYVDYPDTIQQSFFTRFFRFFYLRELHATKKFVSLGSRDDSNICEKIIGRSVGVLQTLFFRKYMGGFRKL